jgi:type I restriction enzyme R subunit
MPRKRNAPELIFQQHIASYLVREHKYGVLEQSDIIDSEHFLAEEQLWTFIKASQSDTLKKLEDNYGTDAREEILKTLRNELQHTPLWMLLRQGLRVRGLEFRLFYPMPRSTDSAASGKYIENRITFRPHFYFGDKNHEIDFVFYLNGLPIIALEVKHEANQNVHNAVAQFVKRDHTKKIFQHPFLYLAADTCDVMAATDPSKEENFRWHNTGLNNTPTNAGEYPVEFLYREVLSQQQLLEALSFFLIRVPEHEEEEDKPYRPAYTIFPRYHQSRMVRRIAEDITDHFAANGDIGKKYLIDHSPGSGKTLSICWLADRLHSLYKSGTNEKLVDVTFILTDRKSLNSNIKEEIHNFMHLKDVVSIATKAEDLPRFLKDRNPIIVTTQQKFAWVLDEIQNNADLKKLRVAFLIDEAHRSQEGRMGAAIRLPFRKEGAADEETPDEDPEEQIAKVIREHDLNQLFIAFTATPSPSTVSLFGKAFDSYTEAEAIAEGYIVDVAASVISYKTLYNLRCPIVPKLDEEKLYPKGVVARALQNVAFQDDGLIQYKAEVMLRIFDQDVKPLIGGRAKAMIVTSSRVAGLRYFTIIKEKLKERGADYGVLYAFSDFVHPETNNTISEHAINGLHSGESIEDRFEGDDYRIIVVANKFQTGFDQPLLAGMFLDKPVMDRNAVQTVSRLNRCHPGKKDVVVVDFTNNAKQILKAFTKYRQGTPFEPDEPDKDLCPKLYTEILSTAVFTQKDAGDLLELINTRPDSEVQFQIQRLRMRFQQMIADWEGRKTFVYLLARFVKSFHFLTCFFTYSPEIQEFAAFAECVGPQLIKEGSVSDLMKQIRATEVIKATVKYEGVVTSGGPVKIQPARAQQGVGLPPAKVSVQEMIEQIAAKFNITDEEALYIRQVTEEKAADPVIHATVVSHRSDLIYLESSYRGQVNEDIQATYSARGRYEELADPKYIEIGAIFDIMAVTVIQQHLAYTEST